MVRKQREFQKPSSAPLQHLKVVEIHGYYGRTSEDELIEYILENAMALERIIVDPRCHYHCIFQGRVIVKRSKKARICAKKLKESTPSPVEFVLL